MAPVREVYFFTYVDTYECILPLAAPAYRLGSVLTNTADVRQGVCILKDKKDNVVGKYIVCKNVTNSDSSYEIQNGVVYNTTFLFNDDSYVMNFQYITFSNGYPIYQPNKKYVNKAISTGGKYSGKDVTITVKTDDTPVRKVIIEYEK